MPLAVSINSMPPEILMMIFYILPPECARKLQIICRIWRDILHNMRLLWTRIPLMAHPKIPLLDGLSIASRQASRSGSLSLTILWMLDLKHEEVPEEIKQSLREFFEIAPTTRWEHLHLWDTSGFLEEFLETEFPFLKSLSLQGESGDYNFRVLKAVDERATSIELLCVTGGWEKIHAHVNSIINRVIFIEMWDNDDFRFEYPENVALLRTGSLPEYLGGFQKIRHLILDRVDLFEDDELLALQSLDVGYEPHREGVDGTLSLPNLLHLKIPGSAPFLLTRIKAPKLRHLRLQEKWSEIKLEDDEDLDELEIAAHYLYIFQGDDFPSSIETLKISYPLKARVFWNMLERAPNLRKLEVTAREFAEASAVIQYLNPKSSAQVAQSVCPKLTYLTILYEGAAETREDLAELCHTLLLMRGSAGLKLLRLVWKDGTEQVMTIQRGGDEESSEEDIIDEGCSEEE